VSFGIIIFKGENVRNLLALSAVVAMAAWCGSQAHADVILGNIVTGSSIDFSSSQFTSGDTASKNWVINYDYTKDTYLWSASGSVSPRSYWGGFLGTNDATHPAAELVWKVTVPTDRAITSFTWAVMDVFTIFGATSDAVLKLQYATSTTGTWSDLLTVTKDTASGSRVNPDSYTGDVLSASLANASSELYLRLVVTSSTDTLDWGIYSAKWSADNGNTYSYITVTTQTVPEPATLGGFALIAGAMMMAKRR